MRFAFALFLLFVSTPVWASGTTDLVKLVVAAYGGSKAIEQNGSFKQSGTLESFRTKTTGTVERIFSRPDKLRVDIKLPGVPAESRLLDGPRGWQNGKEVPPMMAKAMLLQAARLDLPYLIMTAGQKLRPIQVPAQHKSGNVKGLEIPLAEGLNIIAVIDADTGQIIASHGLIEFAKNQQMAFSTYYSAIKTANGQVYASEERHYTQGRPTGKTVLQKSEVVKEIPESVFRP